MISLKMIDFDSFSKIALECGRFGQIIGFFKWAIPGLYFFIFVFSIQLTVNVKYKMLPMTGFEPRTSGIGSDRSTN